MTSVLEKLDDESVLGIIPLPEQGMFEIYERCDEYFSVKLTADELLQLAKEIEEMAKGSYWL